MAKNRDDELAQRGLPEVAYASNSQIGCRGAARVVMIERGQPGFRDVVTDQTPTELNRQRGVTPAQAMAMQTGATFGWNVPGADPRVWMVAARMRLVDERVRQV